MLCETNEIGVVLIILLVNKEKKEFIREEEKEKIGREAGHYIKKQTSGNHRSEGCIRGVYLCIPSTREGNIAQYEYPINTEVNETVNESNIRSIS